MTWWYTVCWLLLIGGAVSAFVVARDPNQAGPGQGYAAGVCGLIAAVGLVLLLATLAVEHLAGWLA